MGLAQLSPQSRSHAELEKPRRWLGWQYTVVGGVIAVSFSLLCNIILLIIGLARYDRASGRGRLSSGSCTTLPTVDSALHILINILSVLLLGASNAAMQCLSAPTRADLDRLHVQGKWADIGVNGFRNLRFMSNFRRLLWAALLISSVPLHLIYNSVIVSSMNYWAWGGYVVTNNFVLGPTSPNAAWNQTLTNITGIGDDKLEQLQQLASEGGLERVDRSDCIQKFSAAVYSYSSVLFVVDSTTNHVPASVGSLLAFYQSEYGARGSLDSFANLTFVQEQSKTLPGFNSSGNMSSTYFSYSGSGSLSSSGAPTWSQIWNATYMHSFESNTSAGDSSPPLDLSTVSYCLAQKAPELCSVDTIPGIQAVVVGLNLIKLGCLLILLYKVPEQPLITLGDAIDSFLKFPDEATRGHGPVNILKTQRWHSLSRPLPPWDPTTKHRYWWARGVSPLRWGLTAVFCISYWTVGAYWAFGSFQSGTFIGSEVFNRYDPLNLNLTIQLAGSNLKDPITTIISSVMIANSFQLLLSIAYFGYNGIVTAMLLSCEWTSFARCRNGLRVSSPRGAQRRAYWLSLPYSYNVPLLSLAAVLHWLLSEAIYYQDLNTLDGSQVLDLSSGGQVGFQDIAFTDNGVFLNFEALTILVILFLVSMLAVLLLACRRYSGGIPIVRSNSLALSHACQQSLYSQTPEDPREPLQWGIREHTSDNGVPDIGLSSGIVDVVSPESPRFGFVHRLVRRLKGGIHLRTGPTGRRLRLQEIVVPDSPSASGVSSAMLTGSPVSSSYVDSAYGNSSVGEGSFKLIEVRNMH